MLFKLIKLKKKIVVYEFNINCSWVKNDIEHKIHKFKNIKFVKLLNNLSVKIKK